MNLSLTKSSFRSIYGALTALYVLTLVSVHVINRSLLEPKIVESRIGEVESLIHSHGDDIQRNNVRALRDQLTKKEIISHDVNFTQLKPMNPKDLDQFERALSECSFLSKNTCVGKTQSVILDPKALANDPLHTTSFAVLLKTDYFTDNSIENLGEAVGLILITVIFISLCLLIRSRELILTSKLSLVTNSILNIEGFFEGSSADEFSLISQSVERLAADIQARTQQIENYKLKFEKKTRLEQLAQLISHTSHDLKAPLEEGADFLQHLPDYLETMDRERLLKSIASMKQRFQLGAESLQSALMSTSNFSSDLKLLPVQSLFTNFIEATKSKPRARTLKLALDCSEDAAALLIKGNRSEFEAVLWNLVKNSYEEKSNAEIRFRVHRTAENRVAIDYRDNGPGIPDGQLNEIFEDFSTFKPKGTGLGLSSCKRIIEHHGGTIRALASSTGAQFEILLPAFMPTATNAQGERHAQA